MSDINSGRTAGWDQWPSNDVVWRTPPPHTKHSRQLGVATPHKPASLHLAVAGKLSGKLGSSTPRSIPARLNAQSHRCVREWKWWTTSNHMRDGVRGDSLTTFRRIFSRAPAPAHVSSSHATWMDLSVSVTLVFGVVFIPCLWSYTPAFFLSGCCFAVRSPRASSAPSSKTRAKYPRDPGVMQWVKFVFIDRQWRHHKLKIKHFSRVRPFMVDMRMLRLLDNEGFHLETSSWDSWNYLQVSRDAQNK